MDGTRDAPALIEEHFKDLTNPTIQHRNAIKSWLEVVKEMEDSDMAVLPSILHLRDDFLSLLID